MSSPLVLFTTLFDSWVTAKALAMIDFLCSSHETCMSLLNCDVFKYPSSALESNGITYLVVMASCRAPPAVFPRADEIKKISLPEDVYVKKFFQKYPDSKHEDAIK